jgi:hypothetical protein
LNPEYAKGDALAAFNIDGVLFVEMLARDR